MPAHLYVSLQGDDAIVRFDQDETSGRLTPRGRLAVPGGPAPMALDPGGRLLHVARRGEAKISSFRVDRASGDLTLAGTVSLATDPCFVATDRTGRFLLSAYYEGRGVTVHRVGEDGALADPPVARVETARGAHCFQTDPTNRFAFVPHIADRGPNEIWQLRFDAETGRLTPNVPLKVIPAEPVGPRHYCFHPRLDAVYFSNEQGSSVTVYRLDGQAGTLSPLQTVPTLPAGFTGENSCSQIRITPSGRFLYAPNRGHDSIAGFAVDPVTGLLTALGTTPAERVPRAFNIDPAGRFLYAAGLETGRLAAYEIDDATGALRRFETHTAGTRPMWVTIIASARS